jgi:hypothetical protein
MVGGMGWYGGDDTGGRVGLLVVILEGEAGGG